MVWIARSIGAPFVTRCESLSDSTRIGLARDRVYGRLRRGIVRIRSRQWAESHWTLHKWRSTIRGKRGATGSEREKELGPGRSGAASTRGNRGGLHQKCHEQTLLRPYFTLRRANVPLTKLIPRQSLCTFEDFWVKLPAPPHT